MKAPTALDLALTGEDVDLAEVINLRPRLTPNDRRQILASCGRW